MTSGLAILDIGSRGWAGLGVKVSNFEAGPGAICFHARTVEEISEEKISGDAG